jgi:hypothetical protein
MLTWVDVLKCISAWVGTNSKQAYSNVLKEATASILGSKWVGCESDRLYNRWVAGMVHRWWYYKPVWTTGNGTRCEDLLTTVLWILKGLIFVTFLMHCSHFIGLGSTPWLLAEDVPCILPNPTWLWRRKECMALECWYQPVILHSVTSQTPNCE